MINYKIGHAFTKNIQDRVGSSAHKELIQSLFKAPVNLFFDVTPIGVILNRVREDVNVFRGHIFHVPSHMFDMSSHFLQIVIFLCILQSWKAVIIMFGFFTLAYQMFKPNFALRRQLDKNAKLVHSPIHSYFHETMRGIPVIKAFGQEEVVLNKQYELIDKTVAHEIVSHSLGSLVDIWMAAVTRLVYVLVVLVAATLVGQCSISTILLLV